MATLGTVHGRTLDKLRDDYQATWGRFWPYDNDYLAELWNETRSATTNANGKYRLPWPAVRQFCLDLMRECD